MASDSTIQSVSLSEAERKLHLQQLNQSTIATKQSVSYVSDTLASIFDTILTMGQDNTYKLNNAAKRALVVRNGEVIPTKLLGISQVNEVNTVFNNLKQNHLNSAIETAKTTLQSNQGVWDKKKQLINMLSDKANTTWDADVVKGLANGNNMPFQKISSLDINSTSLQRSFGSFVSQFNLTSNSSINSTKSALDKAREKLVDVQKKLVNETSKSNILGPILQDGKPVTHKLELPSRTEMPLETSFLKVNEPGFVNGKPVKFQYKEFSQGDLEKVLYFGQEAINNPEGNYKNNKYVKLYNDMSEDDILEVQEIVDRNRGIIEHNKKSQEHYFSVQQHNKLIDTMQEEEALKKEVHTLYDSLSEQKATLKEFNEALSQGTMDDKTRAAFVDKMYEAYDLDDIGERPTDFIGANDSISKEILNDLAEEAYDEVNGRAPFEFQSLSPTELASELDNIDDPTLRALVNAQYQEVVDGYGNKMMQPTPFMGTYDIDATGENYSFKINGVADIEAPGYDIRHAESYLDSYDGFAHMTRERLNSGRLQDGTHVSEIGRIVSDYQDAQKDMNIEAKRAEYLKLANHELEPEIASNVTRVHPKERIPYRIANMMGEDTSLITGTSGGSVLKTAKEAVDAVATSGTKSPMDMVLSTLSSQTDMPNLMYSARNVSTKLDMLNRFTNSVESGDYKGIASAIKTSDGADPVIGVVANSYRRALEEANIDTTIEFGSLNEADQRMVSRKMLNSMTEDIGGSLIGLQKDIKSAGANSVTSKVYDALAEHSEIVREDQILAINELRRGTTVSDAVTGAEALRGAIDVDYQKNIDEMYDSLYSVIENQDQILKNNVDNAMSKKNKRENQAYTAAIKNNYERLKPLELGAVPNRPGVSFTQHELATGMVLANGTETPVDLYKQYYTMNSMKQIMGDDWTHFSPEQWSTGQVSFGKTTMPITQFAEYYTKGEHVYQFVNRRGNKAHEAHIKSLSYDDYWDEIKMDLQDDSTGFKFGLSDADRSAWRTYMSREEAFANGEGSIMVKKQSDTELVNKLNRAKDSQSMINIHGDVVPYSVADVTDSVAVLKQNAININEANISLNWNGEGDLFTALEDTEKLMRGISNNSYAYDLDDEGRQFLARNYKEKLNQVLPGSENVTRKMLLDSLEYQNGMPKVFTDTVASSFSWMMTPENIDELPGLSYLATSRAMADLNDLEIAEVFSKRGLDPSNLAAWDSATKEAAINDLLSHKIESNVLVGFMSEQSGGDKIDTMIRVARNVSVQQGINPTIDDVKANLLQIKKGMATLKSDDSKSYFAGIDELIGDDTLLRERMLNVSDSGPISLEVIGEQMNRELDRLDAYDDIDGLEKTVSTSDGKPYIAQQNNYGIVTRGDESVDELAEIYRKSKRNVLKEHLGSPAELGINTDDIISDYNTKLTALRITRGIEAKASGKKPSSVTISKSESFDMLEESVKKALQKSTEKSPIKQILMDDSKRIAESVFYNKAVKANRLASNGAINVDTSQLFDNVFSKIASANLNKMEKTTLSPQLKMQAISGMNSISPGSTEAMISRLGGVRNVLGELFDVNPKDVGNLDIVNKAFQKFPFANVQQLRNFTRSISDVMPGLEIGISQKLTDENGIERTVMGSLGDYKDANGATAMVATMSDGSKARLVDSAEQTTRFLGLGVYDAEDVSVAKTNSASKHWSADSANTKLVAGLSGNYDMITRRQQYGTSGIDPISTFKLLNEATEHGNALIFDFETTGLPHTVPNRMAFAPIEFSYSEFDFKNKIKKRDVTSFYARPNEAVQEMFSKAMTTQDYDFINDLPTDSFKRIGYEDPHFALLKNYSKYDKSRVKLGDRTYTWGAITSAPMKLGDNGTIIAKLNDMEIDTELTPQAMVNRTKQSANGVFEYLRDATTGTKNADGTVKVPATKKRYGIDPAKVLDEKDFVEKVGSVFDENKFLMGHNISTADVPWYQEWAMRNNKDFRPGTEAYLSPMNKMIDTQDILQASNSGRRFNNLEQFATNSATSHLAYADVITNGNMIKQMLNEPQVKAIQNEVERGVIEGDLIAKTRTAKIGMTEIPKGVYQFGGATGNSITLNPLLEDGSIGKPLTFTATNPAIIKKELADNWTNFQDDLPKAVKTISNNKRSEAGRTLFNGMYNGALDRYNYIGKYGNMDLQEALLKDLESIYSKNATVPETLAESQPIGRFSSQNKAGPVDKDLMLFINSNSGKLNNSKDGFTKELAVIRNINPDRIPEMKIVSDYLDTDEGKIVKNFVDDLEYRRNGGLYSKKTKEQLGRLGFEVISDIKKRAVEKEILSPEHMLEIPNKYSVGKITFEDLAPDMQQHLKSFKPYFGEKEISIGLGSAAQVKGDIFTAGDDIAKMIADMPEVKDIHTARQRVVNEVILPKLTGLSNDANLNEAILLRKTTNEASDLYKHAVNTMASEIVSNRATLEGTLTPLKVVDMANGLQKGIGNNDEVLKEIQESLTRIIADEDFEIGSIPNPVPDAPQKRIPIPGAQDSINKIVEIQKATKNQYLQSLAGTDAYQQYVTAHGIDPIAEGINPLSMWNMNLENSAGRQLSQTLTPEYRLTTNPNKQWMQFKSAKELRSIMDSLPSTNAIPSFESIFKAFANKGSTYETAQAYHRQYNQDAIDFMESKMGKDISHIRAYNEQILEWDKEFRNTRRLNTQGNTRHRAEIARELWQRANMKDHSYKAPTANNVISDEIISGQPTKYNAMKEVGIMQPFADGSGYYTGSIGIGGHVDGSTLDANKIIVPGNAGSKQYGVGINELAGRPLSTLSIGELSLVADNVDAPYNTELFKTYRNGVAQLNQEQQLIYENIANNQRNAYNQSERLKPLKNLHDVVPEYTDALSGEDYIGDLNRATKEAGNKKVANEARENFANNINSATKMVSDNPLYNNLKGNMQGIGDFLRQHKKGISIGAAALGVAAVLNLTSPHSSNGRSANQSPQSNQAPTVDGNYNTSYNEHEGSREAINPQSNTIRLEENGRGLAVRARGKNRSGVSDGNIDKAVSDTMQSTMSASVRINHTDDRSNIDKNYIQGLVSNSLFA